MLELGLLMPVGWTNIFHCSFNILRASFVIAGLRLINVPFFACRMNHIAMRMSHRWCWWHFLGPCASARHFGVSSFILIREMRHEIFTLLTQISLHCPFYLLFAHPSKHIANLDLSLITNRQFFNRNWLENHIFANMRENKIFLTFWKKIFRFCNKKNPNFYQNRRNNV